MNRRLWLLVTSPTWLLGIVLVVSCIVSFVAINSLQNRLFRQINDKITSLNAAHQMEVTVYLLRFHFLVSLMNPSEGSRRPIQVDHEAFDKALEQAKLFCPPEQEPLVRKIQETYQRYRSELENSSQPPKSYLKKDLLAWVHAHPIQQVVAPCRSLLAANQKMVNEAFADTQEWTWTIQKVLFVLALGGAAGGLLSGYAGARTLSRSIARLQVRVQDVHYQVAPEESVVDLQMGQGLDRVHDQLDVVVERVGALVERAQKHQREQMHTQRLAVTGQLASGIAHEIRNPLTAMKWLVDNAVKSYPAEPMRLQDLQVLQGEIERMRDSVQAMLDFVRPPAGKRCRGDLREVIHHALELIRARKRQLGIRCELDLPGRPVLGDFDPGQIKSVLVNLLLNALDAMPKGGLLGIRLGPGGPGEVRLIVEDTGPGIPADMLEEIFSPFVSTKTTGTGLGLTVSKRLVEEHGGRLSAENRADGGARFLVVLPAVVAEREKEGLCQTRAC